MRAESVTRRFAILSGVGLIGAAGLFAALLKPRPDLATAVASPRVPFKFLMAFLLGPWRTSSRSARLGLKTRLRELPSSFDYEPAAWKKRMGSALLEAQADRGKIRANRRCLVQRHVENRESADQADAGSAPELPSRCPERAGFRLRRRASGVECNAASLT